MKSPVIIFAYNRAQHLEKTLLALNSMLSCQDRKVFLYIDGPRSSKDYESVENVKAIAQGFLNTLIDEIFISPVNKGLSRSIIEGVSEILNRYESAIILEDDILVREDFFKFIDDAINTYSYKKDICSITGFSPVQFSKDILYPIKCHRAMSWSWATWRDRWFCIDFDKNFYENNRDDIVEKITNDNIGRDIIKMLDGYINGSIDSWYVRWTVSNFLLNRYTLYPSIPQIENIGFDGTGENCSKGQAKEYSTSFFKSYDIDVENIKIEKDFEKKLISTFNPSLLRRIIRKII